MELPALLILGYWFVLQILSGSLEGLAPTSSGGVAWWAHIGGFLAGVVLVLVMRPRRVTI